MSTDRFRPQSAGGRGRTITSPPLRPEPRGIARLFSINDDEEPVRRSPFLITSEEPEPAPSEASAHHGHGEARSQGGTSADEDDAFEDAGLTLPTMRLEREWAKQDEEWAQRRQAAANRIQLDFQQNIALQRRRKVIPAPPIHFVKHQQELARTANKELKRRAEARAALDKKKEEEMIKRTKHKVELLRTGVVECPFHFLAGQQMDHDQRLFTAGQLFYNRSDDGKQEHGMFARHLLHLPDTILYEKGLPKHWFFTQRDGTIRKKAKSRMNPHFIEMALRDYTQITLLASEEHEPVDCVAQFISVRHLDDLDPNPSGYQARLKRLEHEYNSHPYRFDLKVEYFNNEMLSSFVRSQAEDRKVTGILQKFVSPFTKDHPVHEEVYVATWHASMASRGARKKHTQRRGSSTSFDAEDEDDESGIVTVEKLTNNLPLHKFETTMYARCATILHDDKAGAVTSAPVPFQTSLPNVQHTMEMACNEIATHMDRMLDITGCRLTNLEVVLKRKGNEQVYFLFANSLGYHRYQQGVGQDAHVADYHESGIFRPIYVPMPRPFKHGKPSSPSKTQKQKTSSHLKFQCPVCSQSQRKRHGNDRFFVMFSDLIQLFNSEKEQRRLQKRNESVQKPTLQKTERQSQSPIPRVKRVTAAEEADKLRQAAHSVMVNSNGSHNAEDQSDDAYKDDFEEADVSSGDKRVTTQTSGVVDAKESALNDNAETAENAPEAAGIANGDGQEDGDEDIVPPSILAVMPDLTPEAYLAQRDRVPFLTKMTEVCGSCCEKIDFRNAEQERSEEARAFVKAYAKRAKAHDGHRESVFTLGYSRPRTAAAAASPKRVRPMTAAAAQPNSPSRVRPMTAALLSKSPERPATSGTREEKSVSPTRTRQRPHTSVARKRSPPKARAHTLAPVTRADHHEAKAQERQARTQRPHTAHSPEKRSQPKGSVGNSTFWDDLSHPMPSSYLAKYMGANWAGRSNLRPSSRSPTRRNPSQNSGQQADVSLGRSSSAQELPKRPTTALLPRKEGPFVPPGTVEQRQNAPGLEFPLPLGFYRYMMLRRAHEHKPKKRKARAKSSHGVRRLEKPQDRDDGARSTHATNGYQGLPVESSPAVDEVPEAAPEVAQSSAEAQANPPADMNVAVNAPSEPVASDALSSDERAAQSDTIKVKEQSSDKDAAEPAHPLLPATRRPAAQKTDSPSPYLAPVAGLAEVARQQRADAQRMRQDHAQRHRSNAQHHATEVNAMKVLARNPLAQFFNPPPAAPRRKRRTKSRAKRKTKSKAKSGT